MKDLKRVNDEIARGVTSEYKKIERTVTGAYQQIEDKFVSQFLTHEGESVEEAKARLAGERTIREKQAEKASETRAAGQKVQMNGSKGAGKQ